MYGNLLLTNGYLPLVLFDVNSLKFLPSLVVKDQLRRLAGNLLKDGSLELGLKVPVDEVLHLGELKFENEE